MSYGYDVLSDPEAELELGASLQLRDATITFTSADGTLRRSERDVGPVPILRARLRLPVTAFLNFRYLGGGAEGTSDSEFGDGFTKNWLHFATVSLGFTYDGPPGIRENYNPGYYAAFVLDPDGYRLEAVFHEEVTQPFQSPI